MKKGDMKKEPTDKEVMEWAQKEITPLEIRLHYGYVQAQLWRIAWMMWFTLLTVIALLIVELYL